MFGRYLNLDNDKCIVMPSAFTATPTSSWYMAAGIHLLTAGAAGGDPVVDVLASAKAADERRAEGGESAAEEDAGAAEDVFAGVTSFDFAQEGALPAVTGDAQSALIARLVSAAAPDDELADRVADWVEDAGSGEMTPEWASSDDDWSDADEGARVSMRAIQVCYR
jgi:hypothetical protein